MERRIGTGMGRCQGARCEQKVAALISEVLGLPERELVRGLEDREWLFLAGNCSRVHDLVDSAVAEAERIGRMAGVRLTRA